MGSRRDSSELIFFLFSFSFWFYNFEPLLTSVSFSESITQSLSYFWGFWHLEIGFIKVIYGVWKVQDSWFYSFYITYNHLPLNPHNILVFSQVNGPFYLQMHFLNMKQHEKGLSGLDTPLNLIYESIWEAYTQITYVFSLREAKIDRAAAAYQWQIPNIFHILGHLRLWKANKPWAGQLTPPKGSRRQKPQLLC